MSTTPPSLTAAGQGQRSRSRTRLLAAATELLVEGGSRSVTVDAVAERSGVAKSTLYRHWNTVNELLVDVMRANVPEPSTMALDAGFEVALRKWMHQAVVTLSSPGWARILSVLLEMRTKSPEMAELLEADFEEKLTTVAAILDLGTAEGRLPAGLDPRLVTEMLVGPLVLAVLSGDAVRVATLSDYVVGRFLTSYPVSR